MGQYSGRAKNNQLLLHPRWKPSLLLVLKPQFMLYGCGILSQDLVLSTLLLNLLRIYCDNTAAIFFSKNDKFSSGSKHIDLKYLVKEIVQKQQVSIENIRTTLVVVDPLTKGLPPKAYLEHVMRMGLLRNP